MTGINRSAALRLRGLLCGAAMAAIVCATPAMAQDETGATEAEAPSAAIVVTGSRIRADGMQAPTPVTVVDAEAIETLSPGPIITGISQLPQFYGNQTPNAGPGFFNRSGYGALNLRGLGVNRTLTLLNGRRMPSSTAFGGVDVNMFPEAMISSVETTTGGASAAYGSDAVAGVVNFMLDTNFTGLELSAQGGITDRGDNEQYELSASYGMELGDRGHLLVSGEYADQNGIFSYKGRDWYQSWSTFGAGTSTSPYTFLPHVISSNGSFDGIIISPNAAINGLSFDRNGNVVPFNRGTTTQGAIGTPASRHVLANGVSGDDLGAEVANLYPDLDRYSAFAYADYEVTDSVKVFAQFLRGRTHTFQYNAPRGGFLGQPTTITIFADNAYLPQSLKTTMANNNIASFTLRRSGSLQDVGHMTLDDTTTQNIATAGFEADLSTGGMLDGWNVSGYYQYGNSKRDWRQLGLRVDRLFAAVDAVRDSNNNIVCRVSTFTAGAAAFPGCKPVNLFGRGGGLTPTPEGYDYIVGFEPGQTITTPIYYADTGLALGDTETFTTTETKDALTTFTQNFAELSASGDLVEGWAGTISMALGGSWRRDHIRQIVHDVTNPSSNHTNPSPKPVLCNSTTLGLRGVSAPDCANTVGNQYSKVSNILGTAEVWEAFGEVLMPLVDIENLSVTANGAVRWADYAGSGTVWAYKGGLEAGMFDDVIRLRGTYSRDVRAGNLSERYDKTGGTATIIDRRYPNDGNVSVTRYSGGNPNVRPEQADTMTLGVVIKPQFASNFSASLDYYRIEIKDAISQVGNQSVVDRCELNKEAEFCALITRDPTTDRITLVGDVFVNVAKSTVSGLDAEVAYSTDDLLTPGDALSARVFGSWLFERSETNSLGVTTEYAGQTGARQNDATFFPYADFKATATLNYRLNGVSAMVQGRYVAEGKQDATLVEGVNIVDNTVDDVLYVDLRVGYDFDLAGAEAEVFLNATNLFDVDPPVTPSFTNLSASSIQYNAQVYDVLGRRYTAGVKLKF